MDCKCESCARKDCPERTKQDDLRIVISCLDYVKHEMTNADRIRAMSDEELSTIMVQMADLDERIPYCKNLPECDVLLDTEDGIPIEMCANCMLAWLKQPAEVDND